MAIPLNEDKKRQIQKSAARLFARKGYAGASVRDIASGAGVGLGSVYSYFPDKASLLKELFSQGRAHVRETLNVLRQTSGREQRIPDYISSVWAHIEQNKDTWRIIHMLRYDTDVQKIMKKEIKNSEQEIFSLLSEILPSLGIQNQGDQLLFFSMIDGLTAQLLLGKKLDKNMITSSIIKLWGISK